MQEVPVLRLMLFDRWRLLNNGQAVHVPARCQRLVTLLALRGRQTRSFLAGALWPTVDEHRAQASLRAVMSTLNRQTPWLVRKVHDEVQLVDGISVDVDEFRTNAELVLSGHQHELPRFVEHATVIGGDLLPGWYDDWVVTERERIHQIRLHVLEALSSQLTQRGAFAHALVAALRAVELDPLRESARRSIIEVHLAEGNTADAIREFERFRSILRAELHVEPTDRMIELIRQVTAHSVA